MIEHCYSLFLFFSFSWYFLYLLFWAIFKVTSYHITKPIGLLFKICLCFLYEILSKVIYLEEGKRGDQIFEKSECTKQPRSVEGPASQVVLQMGRQPEDYKSSHLHCEWPTLGFSEAGFPKTSWTGLTLGLVSMQMMLFYAFVFLLIMIKEETFVLFICQITIYVNKERCWFFVLWLL